MKDKAPLQPPTTPRSSSTPTGSSTPERHTPPPPPPPPPTPYSSYPLPVATPPFLLSNPTGSVLQHLTRLETNVSHSTSEASIIATNSAKQAQEAADAAGLARDAHTAAQQATARIFGAQPTASEEIRSSARTQNADATRTVTATTALTMKASRTAHEAELAQVSIQKALSLFLEAKSSFLATKPLQPQANSGEDYLDRCVKGGNIQSAKMAAEATQAAEVAANDARTLQTAAEATTTMFFVAKPPISVPNEMAQLAGSIHYRTAQQMEKTLTLATQAAEIAKAAQHAAVDTHTMVQAATRSLLRQIEGATTVDLSSAQRQVSQPPPPPPPRPTVPVSHISIASPIPTSMSGQQSSPITTSSTALSTTNVKNPINGRIIKEVAEGRFEIYMWNARLPYITYLSITDANDCKRSHRNNKRAKSITVFTSTSGARYLAYITASKSKRHNQRNMPYSAIFERDPTILIYPTAFNRLLNLSYIGRSKREGLFRINLNAGDDVQTQLTTFAKQASNPSVSPALYSRFIHESAEAACDAFLEKYRALRLEENPESLLVENISSITPTLAVSHSGSSITESTSTAGSSSIAVSAGDKRRYEQMAENSSGSVNHAVSTPSSSSATRMTVDSSESSSLMTSSSEDAIDGDALPTDTDAGKPSPPQRTNLATSSSSIFSSPEQNAEEEDDASSRHAIPDEDDDDDDTRTDESEEYLESPTKRQHVQRAETPPLNYTS